MALSARALHDTQLAFDGVAVGYGAAMRARARACLISQLEPGAHVLDLGCGPGVDAEALARAGYRVTAIDSSPAMVDEARARVHRAGLGDRVTVAHLGIQDLDRLQTGAVDAAYSNFGALNCVPDLEAVAQLLADRLRRGAPAVASVIGRVCPWELALFAVKRDWTRLRVRFSPDFVPVPLAGRTVWTRYHSPRAFVRVFERAGFRQVSLRGLGLIAPPPYMEGFARRHPSMVEWLTSLDDRVAAWPGLRACGDHFLVVLRRR
jgi:SAM-dependent methyltransferase